jgi:hypothetical protein
MIGEIGELGVIGEKESKDKSEIGTGKETGNSGDEETGLRKEPSGDVRVRFKAKGNMFS